MQSISSLTAPFDRFGKNDKGNLIFLTLLWFIAVLLVNPSGEFPLNDDWVHARAVRTLLETGQFTLAGGHSSSNLVALVYWGALFCLPFGFSFTALRLSTLVLGLVGVLIVYGLIREMTPNRPIALLGALIIALNPIYFGLSNTYMTDVPFFTAIMLGFYFFIRGQQQEQTRWVVFGYAWVYLSILIRQLGVVFPVAFGCAYLARKGVSKLNLIKALAPALLGIALNSFYALWLEWSQRTSPILNLKFSLMQELVFSKNHGLLLRNFSSNLLISIVFISLFASILLIPLFLRRLKTMPVSEKRLVLVVILVLFLVLSLSLTVNQIDIPLTGGAGHILADFGIGPITLHDTLVQNINYPEIPPALKALWFFLKMIAAFTATLFIYYFFIAPILQISKKRSAGSSEWLTILLLSAISLYLLPMVLYGFFDRYLLPLFPLFILFVIQAEPWGSQTFFNHKIVFPIILVGLIGMGIFTVGATHDYLAWNRTRWQALNNLLQEGRSPREIDGGYEFNGWYLYDPNDFYSITNTPNPAKPEQSRWFVDQDTYLLTLGPLKKFEVLTRYPVDRWLPFSPEFISVLRRQAIPQPSQ
jgi:hypothetical protein